MSSAAFWAAFLILMSVWVLSLLVSFAMLWWLVQGGPADG